MNVEEWKKYIAEMYSTDAEYLWKRTPNHCVFRHFNNNKWFVLIADVSKDKLGLGKSEIVNIMNVKLDPMMVDTLRTAKGFFPAYHMSKKTWITIALDGSVPDEQIKHLIDISFELTQ